MIGTVITITFVVGMLALVGYVIFKLTPYARHADAYRDPETGRRTDGGIHLWRWTDET